MALLGTVTKQSVEMLDYDIDYSAWLPADDAVSNPANVTTAVVVVTGTSTADVSVELVSATGTRVKVWLGAGTDKCKYKVSVTVSTDDGRIKQDEFYVVVKDY